MKNIFFILLCIVSFSTFGQQKYSVEQVLDSIIKKGNERGVDMKPLIDRYVGNIFIVDFIEPTPEIESVLGKIRTYNGHLKADIFIIKEMFEDFFLAERVLIHEMGHAMYLKHCCSGKYCAEIMAAEQATTPGHILYEIAFKSTEYELIFDRFFELVKEKESFYERHK